VWATALCGGPSVYAESKGWSYDRLMRSSVFLAAYSYLNSAIFFSESLVAPLKTA
jgi:hypothetical protein